MSVATIQPLRCGDTVVLSLNGVDSPHPLFEALALCDAVGVEVDILPLPGVAPEVMRWEPDPLPF